MKKALKSLFLLFFLVNYISSQTAINNCEDLQNIGSDMTGDYYLNAPITCNSFNPLGVYSSVMFSGTLDGKGYSLSINFEGNSSYSAIFRHCNNANILNITINNSYLNARGTVSPNSSRYAFLCGHVQSSTISYIVVNNSRIESAYNDVYYLGFIAGVVGSGGHLHHITVENSDIVSNLTVGVARGLIAGRGATGSLFEYCYVVGFPNEPSREIVKGVRDIGGLLGECESCTIKYSGVFRGKIVATSYGASGIVGSSTEVVMEQVFVREDVIITTPDLGGKKKKKLIKNNL